MNKSIFLSIWQTFWQKKQSFLSWYWERSTICKIYFCVNVFRKKWDYFLSSW